MLYSSSTGGFYDKDIHGEGIPHDAIEISKELYDKLFEGQSDGKVIVSDENGCPTLSSPPSKDANAMAKLELDNKVQMANQQIAILKPAVDGGYAKQEHTQLLSDWQRCLYELTLVPEKPGWPEKPQWPTEPDKVI
ncbi:tail fiber assembly protein [Aeromonas dhakensis]|uniref:tail fiber assembly protein n=1 Tax=Aeromonas dhakensis TaxID=196024 RepID=UPI001AAF2709|nr:tail fiber assembly protein [Aeromonas dhakensis]MBO2901168.1 tail fiber assembly protein [Aeromonas dhakensis]MBO2995955.1 tail fiber assembly protein [Aeromonas dhakensis]